MRFTERYAIEGIKKFSTFPKQPRTRIKRIDVPNFEFLHRETPRARVPLCWKLINGKLYGALRYHSAKCFSAMLAPKPNNTLLGIALTHHLPPRKGSNQQLLSEN